MPAVVAALGRPVVFFGKLQRRRLHVAGARPQPAPDIVAAAPQVDPAHRPQRRRARAAKLPARIAEHPAVHHGEAQRIELAQRAAHGEQAHVAAQAHTERDERVARHLLGPQQPLALLQVAQQVGGDHGALAVRDDRDLGMARGEHTLEQRDIAFDDLHPRDRIARELAKVVVDVERRIQRRAQRPHLLERHATDRDQPGCAAAKREHERRERLVRRGLRR